MKLEDKVCTLEQAKRLVELGVVLDAANHWTHLAWSKPTLSNSKAGKSAVELDLEYPAPDVAELGELLGNYNVLRIGDTWMLYHKGYSLQVIVEFLEPKTEAQARVDALIWLIENNCLNFYQEKDE